jgi:A/G-specific adenine glycosylase
VDGNVLRVVSRLLCDETPIDSPKFKRAVRQWLEEIYPSRSGDFTQALMELGATLCGPNWKPRCEACPCREFCLGHLHGTAESLPVKSPKRGRRKEQRTVFILSCDGQYALQKRPNKGLLAGLWQFPNVTGKLEVTDAMKAVEEMGLIPTEIYRQVEKKHIFTHIEWEMRGIYMEVKTPEGDFSWFSGRQTNEQTALPTAFRQFWEEIDDV